MTYIYILLADLYLFFIMYVASMNMVRAHKVHSLTTIQWVLCVPFIAISLIVDILHNVFLFSFIFGKFPRELTVTERLKRHVFEYSWRGKLARWFGNELLNAFDHTGNHLD